MFQVNSFRKTHHVYSTLKQYGNGRFHVVSTWNARGVFEGLLKTLTKGYHGL